MRGDQEQSTLSLPGIEHGVEYGAAQRCQKDNGRRCEPCRKVVAAYMREYRRTHPDYREQEKKQSSAYGRALRRLAERFPEEFHEFYQEELSKGEVDNGA